MNRNVYFDVCGTLFYENTTFGFVLFYHRKNNNIIRFLYCYILLSFIGKILHRLFGVSLRTLFLSTINGKKKNTLDSVANEYIDYLIENKRIDIVFDIFKSYIESQSHNVILLSASIDVVIDALAKRFSIQYYSSELEYSKGVLKGGIAYDLKGNKHYILNSDPMSYEFYSDNLDDLPCASCVDNYYYVVHKTKIDKSKQIHDQKNIKVLYV